MTPIVKAFYESLSFIGSGPLYFIIFLVIFNWGGRARAFYYLFYLCGCLCLINVTKIAYHNPRPYMVDNDVVPYGCSHEWGNPSGHSLFASGFFFFMFLDIFHSHDKHVEPSNLIYALTLIGTLAITFLIGFARLYVGVHSIDQIIFGWMLGFWIAFYFHICLRNRVLYHINRIILK